MLENLCEQECVERGLVVPDLGVEAKPVDAQGGLRQLESLVSSDLDRGGQRQKRLKHQKSDEKGAQNECGFRKPLSSGLRNRFGGVVRRLPLRMSPVGHQLVHGEQLAAWSPQVKPRQNDSHARTQGGKHAGLLSYFYAYVPPSRTVAA